MNRIPSTVKISYMSMTRIVCSLACSALLSVPSFAHTSVAVAQRQVKQVNVIGANLRLMKGNNATNQYAIRVKAEYPNACFALSPREAASRVVFSPTYDQNSDLVQVQVFEMLSTKTCPQIYAPVQVEFEVQSIRTHSGRSPNVLVNGVEAR